MSSSSEVIMSISSEGRSSPKHYLATCDIVFGVGVLKPSILSLGPIKDIFIKVLHLLSKKINSTMVYIVVGSRAIKSLKWIKDTFVIKLESYITETWRPLIFSNLINSHILVLSSIHHTLMQENSPVET